jgi:tellurite resistance protein
MDSRTIPSTTFDRPVMLDDFDSQSMITSFNFNVTAPDDVARERESVQSVQNDNEVMVETVRRAASIAALRALEDMEQSPQLTHTEQPTNKQQTNDEATAPTIAEPPPQLTITNTCTEQPTNEHTTNEEATTTNTNEEATTTNTSPRLSTATTTTTITSDIPKRTGTRKQPPNQPPTEGPKGPKKTGPKKQPPNQPPTAEPKRTGPKKQPPNQPPTEVAVEIPSQSTATTTAISEEPEPTGTTGYAAASITVKTATSNVNNKQNKRNNTIRNTRSVSRRKISSIAASQQRNLLEDTCDDDSQYGYTAPRTIIGNLKDDRDAAAGPVGESTNVAVVKQEPPDAEEEILRRGGRKPMSEKDIFEQMFMLSTTEHKLRFGFYDVQIYDDDLCTEEESTFEVNEEFLSRIPTKFQSIVTCVICTDDIDITKECVVNMNCEKAEHRMPHPIHKQCYDLMIRWGTQDTVPMPVATEGAVVPDDQHDVKVVQKCSLCRTEGDYMLSKLNTATNLWEKWKKLPDGVPVFGAHRYTNWINKRQYQHLITDKGLMHSICRNLKIEGPRIEKPKGLNITDCKRLWYKYLWLNNETFTCQHCQQEVINLFKIWLNNCQPYCKYFICRACFLKRITTEPETPGLGYNKNDGYLLCEQCNKVGRAQYDGSKVVVADKERNGLR